jgi:hypothetical protein
MHPFRKLLQIALGRETSFRKTPSRGDWEMMLKMARYQALVGIGYEGIQRLPQEQLPPLDILDNWSRLADKVAGIYRLHEQRVEELEGILEGLGLHACLLKGTVLSHLYPHPESRMCGDIDIWVEGTHESILKALEPACKVHGILYQECKADFFEDVEVEVHFHPTKMYNPFLNARLQKYLTKHSPIHHSKALAVPGTRFNAVFCMAHMFHHYLEGGLGMRQMMDYYYILRVLDPTKKLRVMKALRHLGMGRFTAAMMEAIQVSFGLESQYLLCDPNRKRGRRLMNDALNGGNFGVLDHRNHARKDESRLRRFFRKTARVWSYLIDYPREVIWAPYARLKHYFWRLRKGYL